MSTRFPYLMTRWVFHPLFFPFMRFHVLNRKATAGHDPYVLVANHISHFDPQWIGYAGHGGIDWMAMVELFRNPVMAAYCRACGAFPVDRDRVDREAIRTALARLKEGRRVGIFPEGGIRTGAESVLNGAPIRPGAGALAQMSGLPVLPAVILGTDRLYSPRAWIPFRRNPIWVAFGERIPCPGRSKQDRQQLEMQIGEALRGLYGELKTSFRLTDDDLPQPTERRKGRSERSP